MQAALGHLMTLRHDRVLSFTRCDEELRPVDGAGASTPPSPPATEMHFFLEIFYSGPPLNKYISSIVGDYASNSIAPRWNLGSCMGGKSAQCSVGLQLKGGCRLFLFKSFQSCGASCTVWACWGNNDALTAAVHLGVGLQLCFLRLPSWT